MSGLEFDEVEVVFGRGRHTTRAVGGVSLSVPPASVVGLVGESGSGKSTLARTAVGLVPLASGRVTLDGVDIATLRRRRGPRPIQMVFQDPYSSLDPRMSIGASITEAMLGERDRATRRRELDRLLDLVGLDPDAAPRRPAALSGGQRQRVALARALAGRPHVVIADEITSALDVSVQGAVLNLVRRLHTELGISLLFISHDLAVIRYLCERTAVMRDGELVEQNETMALMDAPNTDYTRRLIAAIPQAPHQR